MTTDKRWCVVSDFRPVGGRYEIGPALLWQAAQRDLYSIIAEWRASNGMAKFVRTARHSYMLGPELPGARPVLTLVRETAITPDMLDAARKSAQQ